MRKVIIGLLLIGLLVTPVNALVIRSGGERNLGGGSTGLLLGTTDISNVSISSLSANNLATTLFTATASGVPVKAYFYFQHDQSSISTTFAIYNSSSELVAYSDVVTGVTTNGTWREFDLNVVSGKSIVSGQQYYAGITSNSVWSSSRDTSTGTSQYTAMTHDNILSSVGSWTSLTTRTFICYVTGGD